MIKRSLAAIAGGCALISGCISLDVTAVQPAAGTAFTRQEVLADPSLMEFVVAGVFVNFWGGATYNQPWIVLSIYGEELTSAVTSFPNFNRSAAQPSIIWEHAQEIAHQREAFDNSLTGTSLLARDPWSNFYEANAASTDMPRLMRENNIRIIDKVTGVDNTDRMLAFAAWIQGMSHVYLGLLFDSAAIIGTDVDLSKVPVLPLHPYQEVLDSGIKWLEDVIEICDRTTFLLPLKPDVWVYNTAFTNTQMKAVAHSFIARALVYSARTPEERAAVDWARVREHVQNGVTASFGPTGLPNPLIAMDYRAAMTAAPRSQNSMCNSGNTNFCNTNVAGAFRVDQRIVGPADTSGAYQAWLAAEAGPNPETAGPFIVATPDARIQAPGNTNPLQKPTYFKFTDSLPPVTLMDTVNRGKQYSSRYWNSSRALNNHTQFPATGGGRNRRNVSEGLGTIQDAMMLSVEMTLLEAEAEFRLGNLQRAADLINLSRVTNGELPAVTAAGVPASSGCVPRRYDNSCGTLFDALMYEKRIETYGTGVAFFDARGWGCMVEGTLTQLPPPGRQLDLQNRLIYTFGGHPGEPGSASKPTNCPLLFRP